MHFHSKNKHLDAKIPEHTQGAGTNPSDERRLRHAEAVGDSFRDIGYKLERTYRAPRPAEKNRNPDHRRPPDAPHKQRQQVTLGEEFCIRSIRGKNRKVDNGQYDQTRQKQELE